MMTEVIFIMHAVCLFWLTKAKELHCFYGLALYRKLDLATSFFCTCSFLTFLKMLEDCCILGLKTTQGKSSIVYT